MSMQNMAQMAMGAMQIAQALLGMMAASKANSQANQDAGNNAALGDLTGWNPNGGSATSPTPTSANNGGTTTGGGTGSSGGNGGTTGGGASTSSTGLTTTANTGTTGSSGTTVTISPSDLRTGSLGNAMSAIESAYGIPRDQFAAALAAGTSPQDLLSHAPKNTPSADMLNKISDGLAAKNAASSQDSVNRILASAGGTGGGGAGTSSASASGEDGSVELGKAGGSKSGSSSDLDAQLDALLPPAGVSPEVRAAMTAKAALLKAEKERQDVGSWNLFQLVHSRYRKLETMLYGRVDRTNASSTSAIKGF